MSSAKRAPRRRRQLPRRPIDYVIAGELGVEPDPASSDSYEPSEQYRAWAKPGGRAASPPRKRGRPGIRGGVLLLFYGRLLWLLGDPPSGRRGGYGLPPGQQAPRPRKNPYDVAKTLAVLSEQWSSWEEDWQLTPCRPFPTAAVESNLAAGVSPQQIAHLILAAWFGVDKKDPDEATTVPRYISRFRRTLPLAALIALGI